jgi:hypothetical protein
MLISGVLFIWIIFAPGARLVVDPAAVMVRTAGSRPGSAETQR